jgi:N-acetylglucosaminyldiphosphoundecaprenol N-acetyl-beta-D-mannosaminyltransferase
MNSVHRINVLGVGISEINHATAVECVRRAIESGHKGYITVTGVHGVTECQRDEELRRIHNESFLSTPDGMPMVWMGRLSGSTLIDRVYGPDMMLNVMREGVAHGWRHFLFGGGAGVAGQLKSCLESRIPGVQIVGLSSPPFRPLNDAEVDALARQVSETRPHCFWVGLSTPKQERFMAHYLPRLDTCLMFGVGAAFDFHAGLVPQAPAWIQWAGLEWLFRLCKEPRRLWKRYFKIVPSFIVRAALQKCGLRKFDPVPDELRSGN